MFRMSPPTVSQSLLSVGFFRLMDCNILYWMLLSEAVHLNTYLILLGLKYAL